MGWAFAINISLSVFELLQDRKTPTVKWVEVPAIKSDDLSSILGTYMVEQRTPQNNLDLHRCITLTGKKSKILVSLVW